MPIHLFGKFYYKKFNFFRAFHIYLGLSEGVSSYAKPPRNDLDSEVLNAFSGPASAKPVLVRAASRGELQSRA